MGLPERNHGGMAKRPTTGRQRRKRENPPFYLGLWIRRLRLRQVEVAKGAGVNEGYISELVNGSKYPKAGVKADIARFMGIPPHYLDNPPPEQDAIDQVRGIDSDTIQRLKPLN